MPYETEEQKRRRITEMMAASLGAPSSFVSTGNEIPPPIRSVEDVRARHAESDRQMRGPMYADSSGGMLEPPRDTAPTRPIINMPPPSITAPAPVQPIASETGPALGPMKAPRIGYSTAGLTGTDALVQRRKAMQEADPESNVTPTGEIEPPQHRKGFWGHVKSAGEGALTGLAMADPDNPNNILGSAIGGLGLGAANPRGQKKFTRRFEMNQLDNDIARGLKLQNEQAQIGHLNAQTAALGRGKQGEATTRIIREGEYPDIEAGTEIRVRYRPDGSVEDIVDPVTKLPVISKSPKAERAASGGAPHESTRVVEEGEYEGVPAGTAIRTLWNGTEYKDQVRRGKPLVATESTRTSTQETRERAGKAAKEEFDRLVAEENEARVQKDAAYKALHDLETAVATDEKGNPRKDASGNDIMTGTKEDVAFAQKAAADADAHYRSFGEKKRDAQRRMAENTPTSNYSGRTMSQANLERYAKDHGMTPEAAKAKLEKEDGVTIR